MRWTESLDEVLDADIDIFVELIGGRTPAADWICRALERGVSVVTANKQVIAHDGQALFERAAARGQHLRFEAAVAGGIPVIGAIESGLAGDQLTRVAGILNGTCNYILTQMQREGAGFMDALREAQALGFAEADPSQDIDGLDAQAKLAILAMVALGVRTPPGLIATRSIAAVDGVDFTYARAARLHDPAGRTRRARRRIGSAGRRRTRARAVRLAARARSTAARTSSRSTAASAARRRSGGAAPAGSRRPWPCCRTCSRSPAAPGRSATTGVRRPHRVSADAATPYYVRFTVADRPGIIAALAPVLARHEINIDAILQEPGYPAAERPFVVTLDAAPGDAVAAALQEISALDFHRQPPLALPVLGMKERHPAA